MFKANKLYEKQNRFNFKKNDNLKKDLFEYWEAIWEIVKVGSKNFNF